MKVLIIEDDLVAVESVSLCFEIRWAGVQVISTAKGAGGAELVDTESPDVVILDLGLPDIDGMEVLRHIRSFSDVPLIILTGRDDQTTTVRGLELGADDYITKPFDPMVLLARVKAILRRSQMPELRGEEKAWVSGNLVIDLATRETTLSGKPVKLTPTEYQLLYHLVRNEGKVLSHRFLLQKVWGEEYIDSIEFIKKYIHRLREKLGDDLSNPKLILSERGMGYKLIRP